MNINVRQQIYYVLKWLLFTVRGTYIYSNFTAETIYTHIKWCSTIYLRNKKKKVPVVQPTSIYSPWNKIPQIFKLKSTKKTIMLIMMMEYEQLRKKKKNIILYIYLFSSEMKTRRATERWREREGEQVRERERKLYYIFICLPLFSLSLPISLIKMTKKKKKERGVSTDEQ